MDMAKVVTKAEAMKATGTKQLTPLEKTRNAQRLDIEKLAKSKPEDLAQLIKVWLSEE